MITTLIVAYAVIGIINAVWMLKILHQQDSITLADMFRAFVFALIWSLIWLLALIEASDTIVIFRRKK